MDKSGAERRIDSAARLIAAPAETIYRVLVDGSAWERWLPPAGMIGRVEIFEPRVGGRYRMVLTYRGDHEKRGKTAEDTDIVEGRFIEFVRDEKVVHAVTFESEDPAFAGDMRMTWSLSPAPAGPKVTITCENVPVGISQADHDVGLRSTLANLATFME